MNILVFDENEMFRKGIRWLLSSIPWVAQIYDTGDINDTLTVLKSGFADILLFDPYGISSVYFSIIPRFRECSNRILIVVLTDSRDPDDILISAEYCVNGYLIKNMPAERFKLLLHDISVGEIRVDDSLGSALFKKISEQKHIRLLTGREREIYHHIRNGLSNKEIARLLGISLHTVKNHVSSILHKLDISSRYQLLNDE